MKTIKTPAIISSIRSKVDGSLGMTIHTPEMTNDEKVEFLNLQGKNVSLLIEPERGSVEEMQVEAKMEGRRPSQRMRSALYILWEQSGKPDTFDMFYQVQMEKFINHIKEKLD